MSWWKKLANKARGVFGSGTKYGGCEHGDAIHLRQGTAEFEWFVARGELEMNRDLKHGAGHLANLISYDPGHPEWLELLEGYLAAAGPDPEQLIPRGDNSIMAPRRCGPTSGTSRAAWRTPSTC